MAIRLEDLLASFRRHLWAAAKAPRTSEPYSQSVRYFSRWQTDRGREPVLDELTRHAVAAWLAELAETAEPSTVGIRLRGMRRFCRWLVTEGELEVAQTDGIEIPAPPEKPVPILTDDGLARLLKTCAVPRGAGRRHRRPPAPVPAHLRPPLARRRWAGTGPDDARLLAFGRHALPLRRLDCR